MLCPTHIQLQVKLVLTSPRHPKNSKTGGERDTVHLCSPQPKGKGT